MKYLQIGSSDKNVSQIGLGTWQFGSKGWGYGKDFNKKTAIELVHNAFDLGVNIIDTAEVYGRGESERIIGEAIRGFDREDIVISTKFFPKAIRSSAILRAVKKSLNRLQTSYIDIYLIHWPSPILPLGATLRNMEKLVEEGIIRHIGVSNFSRNRFQKAQHKMTKYKIDINQVNYSIVQNKVEFDLSYYLKEKITIMAYSPLAQGWLSGKYTLNTPVPTGTRRFNRLFRKRNIIRGEKLLKTLNNIAQAYEVPMSQIALSWVLRNSNVIAIPGAKNKKQLEINIASSEIILGKEEVKQLKEELNNFKPKIFF